MTEGRRLEYFTKLYEAINDDQVQKAFLYEMLAEDCEKFDFQGKIPNNEFREDLADAANDAAWQDEFLTQWSNGDAWWQEDAVVTSEYGNDAEYVHKKVHRLSTNEPVTGGQLFKAISAWAKRAENAGATSQCYSQQQLGLVLRALIPSKITKRKSHGNMCYQVVL